MRFLETKRILECKLEIINRQLGASYILNYCEIYGGYTLYETDDNNRISYDNTGFMYRKSSAETPSYLEGIINCLYALK